MTLFKYRNSQCLKLLISLINILLYSNIATCTIIILIISILYQSILILVQITFPIFLPPKMVQITYLYFSINYKRSLKNSVQITHVVNKGVSHFR